MLDAADEIAALCVDASGHFSFAIPQDVGAALGRIDQSHESQDRRKNLLQALHDAIHYTQPKIEQARAKRQRVVLLFGPGSATAEAARDMVIGLMEFQRACKTIRDILVASIEDPAAASGELASADAARGKAIPRFNDGLTRFMEAAHAAISGHLSAGETGAHTGAHPGRAA
jgi:hypothetical protein